MKTKAPKKTKPVKVKVSIWDKLAKRLNIDGEPADVIVAFGFRKTDIGWTIRWETYSWLGDVEQEGSLPKGVGQMIIGAVKEQLGDELMGKINKAIEPHVVEAAGRLGGAIMDRLARGLGEKVARR